MLHLGFLSNPILKRVGRVFVFLLPAMIGCARYGDLGAQPNGFLAEDLARTAVGDLAAPGPHAVAARGITVGGVSVVRGALSRLTAPLLLVGAEVSWKASRVCAPKATNYERFFERAPAGTVELTLRGADHVQLMDDPDAFGQGICRVGGADSY